MRWHSRLRPRLYAGDWRLIADFAKATSMQGVADALDRWQHSVNRFESFGRNHFHWRVSGRRVLALAGALLGRQEPSRSTPRIAFVPGALNRAANAMNASLHPPSQWVQLHG